MAMVEMLDRDRSGRARNRRKYDTDDPEQRAVAESDFRSMRDAMFFAQVTDEGGGQRNVGTFDQIEDTDRMVEFLRPGCL